MIVDPATNPIGKRIKSAMLQFVERLNLKKISKERIKIDEYVSRIMISANGFVAEEAAIVAGIRPKADDKPEQNAWMRLRIT